MKSGHSSPVKFIRFHHAAHHCTDKTNSFLHVTDNPRLRPLLESLHRGQSDGSRSVTRVKQCRYIVNFAFSLHLDGKQRDMIPKFQFIPSCDRSIRPSCERDCLVSRVDRHHIVIDDIRPDRSVHSKMHKNRVMLTHHCRLLILHHKFPQRQLGNLRHDYLSIHTLHGLSGLPVDQFLRIYQLI